MLKTACVVGPLSHPHDTGRAPSGFGHCGKPTADAERPHQWAYMARRDPLDALPAEKAGSCVCVLHMNVQPRCNHNIPPPGTTPAQRSMTGSCPPVCRCSAPNPHVLMSRESSPFLAPSLYTHIPTQRGEVVVDPQGTFSFSCSYTGAQRISRQPTCPIRSLGAWSSLTFIGSCTISVAQSRRHTGAMKRLTRDAV